ncbi:DUF3375 domain-containing protein [Gordonia insulae]|uniref:DUF3375 domain-containing protein n=1 Tax=Gordonia insulae TaxID=2420509 RepID=A0A3G8JHM4_9ACTN|nr:DUF3375 domain-containing protein [Gordonia insulae]AZG44504.1 hypothetical protein D7316_01090 [Gordonia insulae]
MESAETPTLAQALDANRAIQKSAAVRLFAATNSALYVTLMEHHLDFGARLSETELAVRVERDLAELDIPDVPSGLELIKLWAKQGWLHRVTDTTQPAAPNLCYLTSEARSVVDYVRRLRREDSIATGGSINGIAAGLRRVAGQVTDDPHQIREEIEHQIAELDTALTDLEAGRRPEPDLRGAEDEARAIAYQMEQVISDIGQYGSMLDRITTALLDDPHDSDLAYRDRQRQMFDDYEALLESSQSASYHAFTRMIQDPLRRERLIADIETLSLRLPGIDSGLRAVMDNFFGLVTQQMSEVGRTRQRCARRIRRFVAAGTLEQSRGVARQLNDALATANDLLKTSLVDRRLGYELPLATPAITSVGRIAFEINDPAPPAAALPAGGGADLASFASLAGQVDTVQLTEAVNSAVDSGPITLSDMITRLDEPYLAHVIVLWSWALKQPGAEGIRPAHSVPGAEQIRPAHSVPGADDAAIFVRFRSLAGEDRAIEVPALTFTEPIPTAEVDTL